jgi:hypothetical protein
LKAHRLVQRRSVYPCAGGITVTSTEVTDEDKIASEIVKVSFPTTISEPTEIALPQAGATYSEVKYAWTIATNTTVAKIEDGVLRSTDRRQRRYETRPHRNVRFCDESKEFNMTVALGDPSYADIVKSAYNLEAGASLDGTYRLYGEIVSIDTEYSEQYGNITVTIKVEGAEDKPIQCFRMKGEAAPISKSETRSRSKALSRTTRARSNLTPAARSSVSARS